MRVRLWRHDINLATPIAAAGQVHSTRTHLFLELELDGVRGVGEVSPQPFTLNGDAGVQDVIVELEHFTLRQFVEATQREGRAPNWARVTHFAGSRPASSPASSLLEMALLDADLRARRGTIEDQWPVRFETPTQITVSLIDEQPWTSLAGAAQVRAKISSLTVTTAQWSRLAALGMPVLLDFNCSAKSFESVVSIVAEARRHVDVVAVEQPFAPGNVVEHARVAAALDVPISLDEGVRHRRDLDQIVRYQAARLVCI
jgi:L-alanine-DL-glutamate epimerase-like enolase superfamily enzyme